MKQDKLSIKTRVLKEIFNIAPKKYKVNEDDNSKLAKRFFISRKEIENNLDFLFEMGLIRKTPGPNYKDDRIFEWMITDKGLDYLEKKKSEKNQEKLNRTIAFTGGVIALTTIYAFIVQSINLENYPQTYWIITPIFLILVLMCLGPLVSFIINYWQREVFER